MGRRGWTTAAAVLCFTGLVGCGTVIPKAPQSAIESTPTKTTSVTPTQEPTKEPPTQSSAGTGTNDTTSDNATGNSTTPDTNTANGGNTNNSVDTPPTNDSGGWTDPTDLPGISKWDTAHYKSIAKKMLVPEVYEVPKGEVALTIDDGPSPYTQQILDVLNQYHVHATFFFVGQNVERYPSVVKEAVADGNLVEDHSMTHPNFFNVSPEEQLSQIDDDAHLIEQLTHKPVRLFRPPYENFNNVTEQILQRDGMALALWNRDPRDWAAKSASQIVRAVLNNQPSGGVFDMHDKKLTLEALPDILKGLAAKHLKVVLLPIPNVTKDISTTAGTSASGNTSIASGQGSGASKGNASGKGTSSGSGNTTVKGSTGTGTANSTTTSNSSDAKTGGGQGNTTSRKGTGAGGSTNNTASGSASKSTTNNTTSSGNTGKTVANSTAGSGSGAATTNRTATGGTGGSTANNTTVSGTGTTATNNTASTGTGNQPTVANSTANSAATGTVNGTNTNSTSTNRTGNVTVVETGGNTTSNATK